MGGEALPEGWKQTTLGAVAEFVNGDRSENYPTQADRVAVGVPFINTGHIEPNGRLTSAGMDYITRDSFDRLRSGKVEPGDIVYCLRGSTIGKTARNHFAEGAIASSLVIVRATARACQEYLYFYLASPLGQQLAARHDNGSAQPNLSVRALSNYPLPLPPIDEQRAIAHVLGRLDDKIELNRRMNETLEAMACALFKSWFVDFLPVRAKMAAKSSDPSLLLAQAEPNTWFVYAIECNDGSLYIGQTEDLRQRWLQHVGGRGGSWTRQHPPVRVPYWERLPSREAAVERERWLKTGYGRKWLKKEIAARTQTGDPLPAPQSEAARQAGGLPKPLADLFPARLVDSELGEIPEGWGVGCVDDEFDLTMGQSPPGETYNEVGEGLPFYQGRADFGSRFPSRRVYCTAPSRLAKAGDTLISVRAPVGDINMATEDCAIGRGVAAARHRSGSRSYSY